jgi:hypothetical protein
MSNRELVEGRRDDGWMQDRNLRESQQRDGRDDRERFDRDDQQRWGREDARWPVHQQQGYNQPGYALEQQRQLGRPPKGFVRSDERIKEEICEFILRSGWVDAENVIIEVQEGEVTLSGTVDDRRQKRAIEDLSGDVLGVKDVHNQIRIQPQQQEREGTGSGRSRKPTA